MILYIHIDSSRVTLGLLSPDVVLADRYDVDDDVDDPELPVSGDDDEVSFPCSSRYGPQMPYSTVSLSSSNSLGLEEALTMGSASAFLLSPV